MTGQHLLCLKGRLLIAATILHLYSHMIMGAGARHASQVTARANATQALHSYQPPAKLSDPIAAQNGNGNPNPGVLPPNSAPHGKTYAEWSAAWFKWAYE